MRRNPEYNLSMVVTNNIKNNFNKTFIWGGKSQLRLLIPYLKSVGRNPDYVFDPYLDKLNFPIEGFHFNKHSQVNDYASKCDSFLVAIGDKHGGKRCEIANLLKSKYQLKAISLFHQKSFVCNTSTYGDGLIMMPGSIVNSFTNIGNQCIINTNASVDHECKIGNGVHIMGGAVITGRVKIGDYATIGSNATILPDLEIGSGAFVGAGAVVTKNVNDSDIVIGVPAKKIKNKI